MGRPSRALTAAVMMGLVIRRLARRESAHTANRDALPRNEAAVMSPGPGPKDVDSPPNASAGGRSSKYGVIRRAVSEFLEDDCLTMGAALAYYTTFSLAPLLLVVIGIVGLVFGREAVQHDIQEQIHALIGQGPASEVGAMVRNAGQHSSAGALSAAIGLIMLLFGASGAFAQLQSSLNQVWHVKPDPQAGGVKSFVGHRILSMGMILAIAFLLLVSLVVSAALSAFGNFVSGYLPPGFSGPLLQVASSIASLGIIAVLFAAMFKVLPDAKIRWRDVWIGAGITALLFTAGKYLIGVYLGHSGMASAYGAAGSFVLIVLWIYYSSLIFLFGAEFTRVWVETQSSGVEPKPGAVRVVTHEAVQKAA